MKNLSDETLVVTPPQEFSETDLINLWDVYIGQGTSILLSEKSKEICTYSFLFYTDEIHHNENLNLIKGGWRVSVTPTIVKFAVTGAILASSFYAAGLTSIPPLVLPAVLPFLFDFEKITLSKGDEYLLAEIKLVEEIKNRTLTPKQMYERLSQNLRDQLSQVDFINFLEQLELTGNVKKFNEKSYMISDEKRLKITFV